MALADGARDRAAAGPAPRRRPRRGRSSRRPGRRGRRPSSDRARCGVTSVPCAARSGRPSRRGSTSAASRSSRTSAKLESTSQGASASSSSKPSKRSTSHLHARQRGALERRARQWQECHCAIDSRHASRGGPGPRRRRRLRPLDPGPGLRQRARALRVHGLRRRAPGACPPRPASRSTSPRGLDALAERRHRARPRAAPRAVAAAGGGARRAARRPRPRRARGLDLHRRLRPRRTPACSTAAAPPRTGPTPSSWPSAIPAVTVDPGVLYVDEGDVLTSAGVAAGIDLCLHLVRRDHGAEVANAVARRIVVAPHRDGGQAQFVEAPVPVGGRARPGAHARVGDRAPARAAHRRRDGAPRGVQRAHLRAALPRRDGDHAAAVAAAASASLHARRLLEATDLPVEDVADAAGFGTAASLRAHFRRATATTPLAYRRSLPG